MTNRKPEPVPLHAQRSGCIAGFLAVLILPLRLGYLYFKGYELRRPKRISNTV